MSWELYHQLLLLVPCLHYRIVYIQNCHFIWPVTESGLTIGVLHIILDEAILSSSTRVKVLCLDLFRLLHHLRVILVDEDSADRIVAGEVCDELVHANRLSFGCQIEMKR